MNGPVFLPFLDLGLFASSFRKDPKVSKFKFASEIARCWMNVMAWGMGWVGVGEGVGVGAVGAQDKSAYLVFF